VYCAANAGINVIQISSADFTIRLATRYSCLTKVLKLFVNE